MPDEPVAGSGAPTVILDLWIPDAGSRGISFGRGILALHEVVWVHAAPSVLRVEATTLEGVRVAFGDQLRRTGDSPMTRLRIGPGDVRREDVWPTGADLGQLVILPGGEVGVLRSWWNDASRRQWRWNLELHNRR